MSESADTHTATSKTPPPESDAAPKGGRPKGSKNRRPALEAELESLFVELGVLLMVRDQFDGMVVMSQAGDNAAILYKASKKNERLKKALERLVAISTLGEIATVLGSTLVPILMHHGKIAPNFPLEKMNMMMPPERERYIKEQEDGGAINKDTPKDG